MSTASERARRYLYGTRERDPLPRWWRNTLVVLLVFEAGYFVYGIVAHRWWSLPGSVATSALLLVYMSGRKPTAAQEVGSP